jgi:hypothetical protein
MVKSIDNQEVFSLNPCDTDKSCKAKLNKRQSLNMANIKENFTVVSDAGIALVLDIEHIEVIVHGYGDLVFKLGKNTISKTKLKELAKKIYKVGLNIK